MNCKNCGAEIGEGALFCGNCGMKVEAEQPVYEAPAQEFSQEVHNEYQEQGSYVPPVIPEYASGAETLVPAEKPNTVLWIVLAAVQIFTCCQLTGIISLIYAILGHLAADKGDFAEAEKKIKTAKTWFWVGIGLGILIALIYVVCIAVFGFAAGVTDEILSGYYY